MLKVIIWTCIIMNNLSSYKQSSSSLYSNSCDQFKSMSRHNLKFPIGILPKTHNWVFFSLQLLLEHVVVTQKTLHQLSLSVHFSQDWAKLAWLNVKLRLRVSRLKTEKSLFVFLRLELHPIPWRLALDRARPFSSFCIASRHTINFDSLTYSRRLFSSNLPPFVIVQHINAHLLNFCLLF